jgi:hypothetical protein
VISWEEGPGKRGKIKNKDSVILDQFVPKIPENRGNRENQLDEIPVS